MKTVRMILIALIAFSMPMFWGCGETVEDKPESDGGADGDADGDSDGDADGDADTDAADTESDSAEVEADTEDAFGCAITGGGTQTGYYNFELTVCDDHYNVQTNPWGGAEQSITAGGGDIFKVDSMQEPSGGESWDVAAFPSVYRGCTWGGGNPTEESDLPISVGEITAISTGLATNASTISFGGNTTFDVYFTNDESYTSGAPDVYLMVWFNAYALNPINGDDEMWDCAGDAPTYIDSCSDAGSVTIDDKLFYRFVGPNGNATVVSYAPETRFDTWEFDLNDFIQDAVSEGYLADDMFLQSIQAGFELTTGGTDLTIEGFYTHINE